MDSRAAELSLSDKDLARFESKVFIDPIGGCWLWMGSVGTHGYGVFSFGPRRSGFTLAAHRIALAQKLGRSPTMALHSCDNRACCNPDHLRDGTAADNKLDEVSRGRHAVGERNGRVKLSDAELNELRELWESGWSRTALGERFGLHPMTASRLARGVGRRGARS